MATFNEIGSGGVQGGGDAYVNDRVEFDGFLRLIILTRFGNEIFDVRADIYSRWKDWALEEDNLKWIQALSNTGGEPLPGGEFLGSTFFLLNGWRIQISQSVQVDGNIFTDDGDFPFVTTGDTVIAQSKVSTLVERVTDVNDNARIFV